MYFFLLRPLVQKRQIDKSQPQEENKLIIIQIKGQRVSKECPS